MRGSLLIAGAVIIFIGFLLTVTIIGAILGIPLIIAGVIVFIIGLFLSATKQQNQIVIQQHVGDTYTSEKKISHRVKIDEKRVEKKELKKSEKKAKKSKQNIKSANNLKPLVFAALFAALLAAVAPFKIPLGFTPVPITLQTLVVLLSGAMLGPTGCYLFSYFIAAFVIGKILQIRKSPKYLDYVLAMIAGTILIYTLGAGWGMAVTGLGLTAIMIGWVLPFIIGDTIKLLIAAYIANKVDIKRYMK